MPSLAQDVKIEKGMAINDFLMVVADKAVTFVIHLAVAALVFYVGRFLVRKILAFVRSFMVRRHVDASIASFVQSASEIVLYFILIIIVIGILGIETSSFIALFASAGVAIGMALSGTLQNFAGGVLVLSLRPYGVGDIIEAQGFVGTVKAIQMFSTIITTPDNKTIIIPNGPLSNGTINNYSKEPVRRAEWTIGVAYGSDFEKAREVILRILDSIPEVEKSDKDRLPTVNIGALADSSVNLTVRAWVPWNMVAPITFRVNERIYAELPAAGIQFPFPQLDVHMVPTV